MPCDSTAPSPSRSGSCRWTLGDLGQACSARGLTASEPRAAQSRRRDPPRAGQRAGKLVSLSHRCRTGWRNRRRRRDSARHGIPAPLPGFLLRPYAPVPTRCSLRSRRSRVRSSRSSSPRRPIGARPLLAYTLVQGGPGRHQGGVRSGAIGGCQGSRGRREGGVQPDTPMPVILMVRSRIAQGTRR